MLEMSPSSPKPERASGMFLGSQWENCFFRGED
jgi:hypothetical protein